MVKAYAQTPNHMLEKHLPFHIEIGKVVVKMFRILIRNGFEFPKVQYQRVHI